MEDFYTIQGEGENAGRPAYFIRLGGCDVGCPWCDVKESWEADQHSVEEVEALADRVAATPAWYVVVTGGEPTLYELGPLTHALKERKLSTWIETAGVHPLTGTWDWVCFSPKKFKAPLPAIYEQADELKIVVFSKQDLPWAEEQAAMVSSSCRLYLQPEWSKAERMVPLIVDHVKLHPHWRISLQTHKYMNIP